MRENVAMKLDENATRGWQFYSNTTLAGNADTLNVYALRDNYPSINDYSKK